MFWKRWKEAHRASELCTAELEYLEGRGLRQEGMYESAVESYESCLERIEALDADDSKEAWRCARPRASFRLAPKNKYFTIFPSKKSHTFSSKKN